MFILGVFAWILSFNNLKNEFAGQNNESVIIYSPLPIASTHATSANHEYISDDTEMNANLFNTISLIDGSIVPFGQASPFLDKGNIEFYAAGKSKVNIYQKYASSPVFIPFFTTGSRKSSTAHSTGGVGALAMNNSSFSNPTTSTMFRAFASGDEEDPFDPGAGTNPGGSYNDAPVGDGLWILLVLANLYSIVSIFRKKQ